MILLKLYYLKIDREHTLETEDEVTAEINCTYRDLPIRLVDQLSVRAKNILKRNNINTLSELAEYNLRHDVRLFRGLGDNTYQEIIYVIKLYLFNGLNAKDKLGNPGTEHDIELLEPVKVTTLFPENTFNLFRHYCNNANIIFADELLVFDFDMLIEQRGFGDGKIKKVKDRFNDYLKSKSAFVREPEPVAIFPFEGIDESNDVVPIDILRLIGVSDKIINTFREKGYMQIKDIKNASESKLIDDFGLHSYNAISKDIKAMEVPLKDMVESNMHEFSKDRSFDMYIKRAEGFTLQEVAEEHNVTRERVRQIVKIFYRIVCPAMLAIVTDIMHSAGTKHIAVQEVRDIFDNDEFDKVIIYTLKSCSELEFLDFANLFLLKESNNQDTEYDLLRLARDFVGEGINLYEKIDDAEELLWENGYEYIGVDSLINLLLNHNYRLYGDYLVFGRQSYGFLCAKLVQEHFKNGIRIYEKEDLRKLRMLAQNTYGDLNLPKNDRAFGSRVSDFLVLCCRGMATAPENISIDISTVETIKEYIDNSPQAKLFFREIFAEFQGLLLMTSNVNNHNFLHGVLSYYYPNEYKYSRDSLIKQNTGKPISTMARITEFVEKAGCAVHKNDIKSTLAGLSDAMLFSAIYSAPEIIQWDYNYYNCISNLHFSDKELCNIKTKLDKLLAKNRGYCSAKLLFEAVKNTMLETLHKNQIASATNIFYIAHYFFADWYDFNRPHITIKGQFGNPSTKSITLRLLNIKDRVSASSFFELSKRLCWSEITAAFVFAEIEKDCIRLSKDDYILKSFFEMTPVQLRKIEGALVASIQTASFFPILKLSDFDVFPPIGFDWNKFLIASLIEEYNLGYKIIAPKLKDRRYQKGIIVKNTNEIKSYDELIAFVMKEQGQNNLSENRFLSFLIINGLTINTIPKELYHSDLLRFEEDKFIV